MLENGDSSSNGNELAALIQSYGMNGEYKKILKTFLEDGLVTPSSGQLRRCRNSYELTDEGKQIFFEGKDEKATSNFLKLVEITEKYVTAKYYAGDTVDFTYDFNRLTGYLVFCWDPNEPDLAILLPYSLRDQDKSDLMTYRLLVWKVLKSHIYMRRGKQQLQKKKLAQVNTASKIAFLSSSSSSFSPTASSSANSSSASNISSSVAPSHRPS